MARASLASSDNTAPHSEELQGQQRGARPPRTSRVLKRKTDHSLIERRRRDKINERLVRLQNIVPACKAEAEELLRSKPPPPAVAVPVGDAGAPRPRRGSRRAKQSPVWTQEQLDRRIDGDMVLEKLCIISHTYDYVLELMQQVKAYGALCKCDPPVEQQQQHSAAPDHTLSSSVAQDAHRAFAHNLVISDKEQPQLQQHPSEESRAGLSNSHHPDSHPAPDPCPEAAPAAPVIDSYTSPSPHGSSAASSPSSPAQMATPPACCKKHRTHAAATAAWRFWGSDHPIPVTSATTVTTAPSQRGHAYGRSAASQSGVQANPAAQAQAQTKTHTHARQHPAVAVEHKDTDHHACSSPASSCGSSLAFASDDDDTYSVFRIGEVGSSADDLELCVRANTSSGGGGSTSSCTSKALPLLCAPAMSRMDASYIWTDLSAERKRRRHDADEGLSAQQQQHAPRPVRRAQDAVRCALKRPRVFLPFAASAPAVVDSAGEHALSKAPPRRTGDKPAEAAAEGVLPWLSMPVLSSSKSTSSSAPPSSTLRGSYRPQTHTLPNAAYPRLSISGKTLAPAPAHDHICGVHGPHLPLPLALGLSMPARGRVRMQPKHAAQIFHQQQPLEQLHLRRPAAHGHVTATGGGEDGLVRCAEVISAGVSGAGAGRDSSVRSSL
ncbi:hypothetical protein K437DRAFT_294626 [Tilletiaria anomala UBC 951]|uniref:BHLH domain-containing protein n=1 Tax=Tilletiaria anomala (strain ATCC 24038 / CBS 436.72 / UBC 951) TaxID=1037660 RepID=A0A066VUU3_TILAU|nr:uncharacterized protein K437DRAFT_294626 [Tilletiaria anomala UBC 951]KDN45251.1 hypothetical protein K437DRAFT_294626 [Tilletiaria anomala UBC 951]